MKTERRHELQTNDLADWLGKHIEHYKPQLKLAGGGIIALLVLSVAYVFLMQQQSAKSGTTWQKFLQASMEMTLDDQANAFESVATLYVGTDTAQWAILSEADVDLSQGSERLFNDREMALINLDKAKKNFSKVEQMALRNPLLLVRAQFGLAQSLECLGELKQAKEKYQQVHRASPESALGKTAEKRAKRLDDEAVGEFYAWFEKQKPRPQMPPGFGGQPPFRMDDLPDRPNFNFPEIEAPPSSTSSKPGATEDQAGEKSEPKADGEKPEPAASNADKPAAESDKPTADDAKSPPAKPSGETGNSAKEPPPESNPPAVGGTPQPK